ncbi:PREDICTED: hepatocyte growth factor-regulated tyrosine kinase substrate [Ipomoea nil]|uniref:hepatocyte growth factor-regulated tyrosine kinase substrate n=1 Tax=Ipomoea nil TaxID=35883 RepID=UPI000901BB26|nr:PREDICTED: hepatocyte growth factor-regulated tyrosine kinase substrate [Ipomoea nil]
MSSEPPPFQEASRCDVCKCSFSTFRRRHHCRCCGRTLCAEHSANQMALPQFDIHSPVRVCADCFNDAPRFMGTDAAASSDEVNNITDSISRLDVSGVPRTENDQNEKKQFPVPSKSECKCGMPLCICETQVETVPVSLQGTATSSTVTVQTNPKPKKVNTAPPKSRGSASNNKQGTVFNLGQVTSTSSGPTSGDYELSGEGMREAIKNGDTAAAKQLLSQGVDANYRDKHGSSLLHLAAVFNQTEIAFALMESGASLNYKNPQGETALDCAPATLQYKMKQKMEETVQGG